MISIIREEKKLYFSSKKNFIRCLLTREHEYYVWRFAYLLRREEHAKSFTAKKYWCLRKNILGSKLGITIPEGVFQRGLHIWHYGNIVVNGQARVGENCILHGDNCIGNDGYDNLAPVIGNNVDIGVGAKIIGNVTIADNIKIGAGAVVVNSFLEEGVTICGVPARVVKTKT